MERVSPTRMELLAKKAQIALAEQGEELLKEKQNALAQELMKIVEVVLRASDRLEEIAAQASEALAEAEALDGAEVVRSASFAARVEVPVEVRGEMVMGVGVPAVDPASFSRPIWARGYGLAGTSSRIDQAAHLFEEEVELIVEFATLETRLRKLAEEIQKTMRRVNALENVLLPRLRAERRYIEMVLEEREREDRFRLRRVKQVIARKKAAESKETK